MKISNRHLAIIALTISAIVWGASPPIFKWSLENVQPFTLAFLRFFIAALILWPFALPHLAIRPKDIPKIILLAAIGITANISFFFLGLQLTSSINAPVIGASAPIFLMIVAFFFLHEKPKKKVIFGTTISLIGTIFIIINPLFEKGHDGSLFGNLLLFFATICFVSYTTLLKKFNLQYPPLTLIFWIFFASSIMFFPLFAFEAQTSRLSQILDVRALVGILYGALSCSALAYLCYDIGVRYLKTHEVGIFTYLDPIVTLFVAVPLLGEKISLYYVIGAITVFIGIFIAESRIHYHSLHPNHLSKKSD